MPEAVEVVILKALSKQPEERYVGIINFARALERASRDCSYVLQTRSDYGNVASRGGGIATDWIDMPKIPDLSIKNSIVAGNTADIAPDISGVVTTGGYNLVQRFTDAIVNDPSNKHSTDIAGDRYTSLGINAQLNNNGGPTPTLALQADSPAVNVIPVAFCDVATDQRGVKRPQHSACDIGAYEYS